MLAFQDAHYKVCCMRAASHMPFTASQHLASLVFHLAFDCLVVKRRTQAMS